MIITNILRKNQWEKRKKSHKGFPYLEEENDY